MDIQLRQPQYIGHIRVVHIGGFIPSHTPVHSPLHSPRSPGPKQLTSWLWERGERWPWLCRYSRELRCCSRRVEPHFTGSLQGQPQGETQNYQNRVHARVNCVIVNLVVVQICHLQAIICRNGFKGYSSSWVSYTHFADLPWQAKKQHNIHVLPRL